MSKIYVMDHPLIQHKIGWIRRKETGSKDFRTLIGEIVVNTISLLSPMQFKPTTLRCLSFCCMIVKLIQTLEVATPMMQEKSVKRTMVICH